MSRNLLRYTCSYLTYVLAAHSASALTYNIILTPMRTRRVELEGSRLRTRRTLVNGSLLNLSTMICQPTNAVATFRPTFRSPRSSQPQSPGVYSHLLANRILYTNAPEKSNMRGRVDPFDVMLSCGEGVIQCEASTVSFTRARTRTRSIFVYSSIDVQMSALVTPAERFKKGLFGSSDRCG